MIDKSTLNKELPDGWDLKPLPDCVEKVSIPRGIKIPQSEYSKNGRYPVIDQGADFIAGFTDDDSKLYKGDLPVVVFGDHTRIFKYVDFYFSLGADGTKLLRPNEFLDPKFFYFYLLQLPIENKGYNRHYKYLMEKRIIFPEKKEQLKISSVLSKIQQAITQQEKIIAKTNELKRSLMRRLFTYGLRGEDQKETDAGTMPINWEVVSLGNICTYTTGKLNSNAAKENGSYPFFTCSQETYKIDNYSFDQEALLLAGNNARAIYSVKYYKGKFDAYQRTYVFTIKDKEKCAYRYLLYELIRKLEMLRISSLGTTTKYITAGIISNLQIALPSLAEQEEIAEALQTIDEKINFEVNRKNYLNSLFRTVLQLLMTGQVRVKDLEF